MSIFQIFNTKMVSEEKDDWKNLKEYLENPKDSKNKDFANDNEKAKGMVAKAIKKIKEVLDKREKQHKTSKGLANLYSNLKGCEGGLLATQIEILATGTGTGIGTAWDSDLRGYFKKLQKNKKAYESTSAITLTENVKKAIELEDLTNRHKTEEEQKRKEEQERKAKEKAEQERKEREEKERLEKERLEKEEQERKEREEQERLKEQERLAKEKEEEERLLKEQKEKEEQERLLKEQKEKEEQERLLKEQKEKEEQERKQKEEEALKKKENEDRRKKEKEERDKLIKTLDMKQMVEEAKRQQETGKPWGYYIQNQRASDGWSAEHGSVVLRFPKKEVGRVALLDTKGQRTKYAGLTYEIDGPHLLVFYADGRGVEGELPWPLYEQEIMENGSVLSDADKEKLKTWDEKKKGKMSLREYENKGKMAEWNWKDIK